MILDLRLGTDRMTAKSWVETLNSCPDNPKSTIQNRKWLGLAVIAFVLLGAVAEAQQPTKIPQIGFLTGIDRITGSIRFEEFRRALRELGYVEGENIVLVYRNSDGKPDRAIELAAELVHLKVDTIVVAAGLPETQAAKNATKTIPIVMAGRGIDPVVAGLVESLAHPGGNVTGITNLSRELGGKRLELLKEAAPKTGRVAVLYESNNPGSLRELKEILPGAARALRLTVHSSEVRGADGFEIVFAALSKERPDGVYLTTSPLMTANLKRIVSFLLTSRFPAVGSSRTFVDEGGLLSYDADSADSYRRVANYVDRILKGAKPAELPVQQPTKFELAVNLKTAKQVGLIIPPNVLAKADRVIR
jgi:putative tryptophan/tyrosine transport system substrate-binding protein